MARFDPNKMAQEVVQECLDTIVYEGKTFREWIEIISKTPKKHGHWIHCNGKSNLWYCSECGDKMIYNDKRRTYNIVKLPMAEKNKFCRNCGAKMDGDPDG